MCTVSKLEDQEGCLRTFATTQFSKEEMRMFANTSRSVSRSLKKKQRGNCECLRILPEPTAHMRDMDGSGEKLQMFSAFLVYWQCSRRTGGLVSGRRGIFE